MKNIWKILVIVIVFASNSANAQRTVSLRQFETILQAYRNSADPAAAGLDDGDDITYIHDVNNELNPFVGVWKGNYGSSSYEIQFVKKTNYKRNSSAEKNWDLLKAWITVKDWGGNVTFTNTTRSENLNGFSGDNFQGSTNTYRLSFTGNCYNESGNVFTYLKPDGTMSLSFAILPDMQSNDCPNGFTPVLPLSPNHVVLTKQP